jgi:hypothetical protein
MIVWRLIAPRFPARASAARVQFDLRQVGVNRSINSAKHSGFAECRPCHGAATIDGPTAVAGAGIAARADQQQLVFVA